ncbi:TPA_asm: hypothetical protein G1T41_23080 [Salmonella enterica subsp. enterica serovar Typhi str. CT18]|uniref:Uncharacterized protein n=1 Tax=Salmonella enterica subsp. enterica serovar Typhi str. CT18 TaxID=220341 RepID=A0A714SV55_SALTI|nr:hypothetical protein [Salmonella enterica]EBS1808638.1 hypothetical protein [Salmonella enterica subsp. enterica serovar Typhi]HAB6925648.1 hypothetical protein [Salmonella enterica subsp. enterica serovar Typhi str. CT18]EAN4316783.1 hypothetical protein [Salmonella enterica]EAO7029541.1 hypothetical protein [Salmonella enterica]
MKHPFTPLYGAYSRYLLLHCLSFGCISVFSPSFEGFFFHFLLRPILLIALANRTMPLPALS